MNNYIAGPIPPATPAPNSAIRNPVLGNLSNMSGIDFFGAVIRSAITLGIIVGSVVFVFMLLWGAIQWISSGGDKAAVESAKARLTNAFIGLLLLLSVFVIIGVVEIFFGISLTIIDFSGLIIN